MHPVAEPAIAGRPDNHGFFVYDNDADFVDRIAPFAGSAATDGAAVLAVLTDKKWELLREALGACAERVRRCERDALYRRPQDALAEYDGILRAAVDEGAPGLRLLGELPVEHDQSECDTWTIYEAALNRAFADRPVLILCSYDLREHPQASIQAAWQTHPLVLGGGWEDNPRYRDPDQVARAATTLRRLPAGLRELPVDVDARAFGERLRQELRELGAARAAAENLLRAALEVFANAHAHGAGPRSQRIGRVGSLIVWELSDHGAGFDDPLAGYVPPLPHNGSGSGLWTVRQLTERVEFLNSPRGFTARLWIRA
jgi:hypothetical protein